MMKNFIKTLLCSSALAATGLHAGQQSLQTDQAKINAQQDPIALNIIKAMQDCVNVNNNVQWKLYGIKAAKNYLNTDVQEIKQKVDSQNLAELAKAHHNGIAVSSNFADTSAWNKAVTLYHKYINDLRQKYNNITRPKLTILPEINSNADLRTRLSLQENQSKFLFQRLLEEYLVYLGQVYEKKSSILGLYRNVTYIASANDKKLSITPNEYIALVQTLDNAGQQKDWGTISLNLLVTQENGSVIEKTLTLHDIIGAIKQVPLPSNYYATALKIAGIVAAAAVVGVGAYMMSPTNYQQPPTQPDLQPTVIDIEHKLNAIVPPAQKIDTSTLNNNEPTIDHVAEQTAHITANNDPYATSRQYDLLSVKSDDGFWTSIGKSMVNDITNLPADIAHRAEIAWENVSSGNYQPGQTTKNIMNKYDQAANDYAYNLDIHPEDSGMQPFDEGDAALLHTAGTLFNANIVASGLKSAGNKIVSNVGNNITGGAAQGVTDGITNFAKVAP